MLVTTIDCVTYAVNAEANLISRMTRKAASVVLVGRPNVGKSTLVQPHDRLAARDRRADGRHDARLARRVRSRGSGATFDLFDTGGLYGASEDPLHELVVRQGQRAIAGADLLVFLVDGREGLVSGDEKIARELRRTGLPGRPGRQQDRRQARARPASRSSTSSASSRSSRSRPSTAPASATCSTRS